MTEESEKVKKKDGVLELVKTIVYALLLAGLIRTLIFQPFWIPSGSMKDTLLIGDFLFVNKFAYGFSQYSCPFSMCPGSGRIFGSEPERGDVIVFRHPTNGTDYIKRLIGLPGDRIQMNDGVLSINGTPVDVEPIAPFVEVKAPQGALGHLPSCANEPVRRGGDCIKERFRETLPNGVEHDILNIGNRRTDNTDVFIVPEGQYFFMGDNRDNSQDSRVSQLAGGVGFVPFENLIGRAEWIVFSSAGRSVLYFWTWRKGRFFRSIE